MQRSATSCFRKTYCRVSRAAFRRVPGISGPHGTPAAGPGHHSFLPERNVVRARKKPVLRNPAVPLPGLAAGTAAMPATARQGGEILAVRIAEAIYRVFVLSCLGLLSLAESFLLIRFGTPFSFSVIQLLWETDGRESLEFLKTYCALRHSCFRPPHASC